MKKIFLLMLVLISVHYSFGQLRLYAERRNIDNTIDSFYVSEVLADSIRTKQGVGLYPTVEILHGIGNAVYPESFGLFIKHGDEIYRNARYYTGYPVTVISVHSDASSNLLLTDQPNTEQPLFNSPRSSVRINTVSFQQARLTAIVMASSASGNNPRLYFQYSTDGVNWIGDSGVGSISLSTTGAKETSWITLPEGAIGDIYVRVAQHGGNGTADPSLGNITIQLR